MQVRLTISGRSYDAAAQIPEQLTLDDGSALDDALQAVARLMPEGKDLPKSCLDAVSGKHLGTLANHRAHTLEEGDELVLIAPVAGG